MTQIVVAKRDGTAKAPDGTLYRTVRGQTLADARHPLVVAYPNDWSPMHVELTVAGDATAPDGSEQSTALDDLRNELAEVEELAEHRGNELHRLAEGLATRGVPLPPGEARQAGWLVDLVLSLVDPVEAPPAPRKARAASRPAGRP